MYCSVAVYDPRHVCTYALSLALASTDVILLRAARLAPMRVYQLLSAPRLLIFTLTALTTASVFASVCSFFH